MIEHRDKIKFRAETPITPDKRRESLRAERTPVTKTVESTDRPDPNLDESSRVLSRLMEERYEIDLALRRLSFPRSRMRERTTLSNGVKAIKTKNANGGLLEWVLHPLSSIRKRQHVRYLQNELSEAIRRYNYEKNRLDESSIADDWNEDVEDRCRSLETNRAALDQSIHALEKMFDAERKTVGNTEYESRKTASGKRLIYAGEFKDVVEEYRGVLAKILGILVEHPEFKSVLEDGVLIERLNNTRHTHSYLKGGPRIIGHTDALKVTLPRARRFFVKVQNKTGRAHFGGGFSQVRDALAVKKALAGEENIRIINYQLGFEDKDKAYLVAEWVDDLGVSADLFEWYIADLEAKGQTEKAKEIRKKTIAFQDKLMSVKDEIKHMDGEGYEFEFTRHNWAYNPETDMFTLYDVGGKSPGLL
jgi:hypothetical protein